MCRKGEKIPYLSYDEGLCSILGNLNCNRTRILAGAADVHGFIHHATNMFYPLESIQIRSIPRSIGLFVAACP